MTIKKIRFPLEMENGAEVRTLGELKEHFSMEKVLLYYSDGRLLKWLRNNYLDEEAEAVSELDPKDPELNKKICEIFDVEYNESKRVDIEEVAANSQRLTRLKDYTSEKRFTEVIDRIAFDQSELELLLSKGLTEIYLCGERFDIPLDKENISYIGVTKPTVVINSSKSVDFKAKNITFQNIKLNEEYLAVVAEEKINADFSGTAEYWVAPALKKCKMCATDDEDIKKVTDKITRLGYVHYSMYLTDFVHDRYIGAQKYTEERYVYGNDCETFIFRNVISMIADNLKYIKKLVDLSRAGLTLIKNVDSSYWCAAQAIADYIKYSGLMLFNFENHDIIQYHGYVFRLGVLISKEVNDKVVSKGIKKSFIDDHCTGYILPFDDIKEILLSKDTVLFSEFFREDRNFCMDFCGVFRDEKNYNPWISDIHYSTIDGSKIKYNDDDD